MPEKCARDRPIDGDPRPDVCACTCAVGEGSCARNSARSRRQAESLGAAFISAPYQNVYGFLLVILVLLLRPSGLFGERVRQA